MTFLNQLLAFGAAASTIPVIIHILNRSRFRTVPWGAMHLLESVIHANHRRFRIEQLILLLIRALIPAMLAFCLARPVLVGSRSGDPDEPVSLVILQDNSYSMDSLTPSGSRLDRAQADVLRILDAVPRGSEISIIQTGGRPTPVFEQPVSDVRALTGRLQRSPGGLGASDWSTAMQEAIGTLAGMNHARRELIVLSDFQPADWDPVREQAASLGEQLSGMDFTPAVTLLPAGYPIDSNVAIESLEYPDRAIGVDQPVSVRANIRNYGAVDYENARVILRIDGAQADITQTTLTANGVTQVLFPVRFDTSGSHTLNVEVVADDRLPTDNRFSVAMTVWETIPVLLVDGDPSAEPLQGETDFLSVALTPFRFGRLRLVDLIETEKVGPAELIPERIAGKRVIVLANVSRLEDSQLDALDTYVRDGGSLLISLGNRIDVKWYADRFYAAGEGLLPGAPSQPRGRIGEEGQSARIAGQRFEHAALQLFNDPGNGDLSDVEIRQWYAIDLRREDNPTTNDAVPDSASPGREEEAFERGSTESDVIIAARLDTGEPLLLESRFGEGRVMLLTTACDDDWSDFPLRPVFVPLMQQLIGTLAVSVTPPRNIPTGQPAVVLFDAAPDMSGPATLAITAPDGTRQTLRSTAMGQRQMARFDSTRSPGIYAMTLPDARTIHFAAETEREESAIELIDRPGLDAIAEPLNATVAVSADEYLEADRLRRSGQEVWKYLLASLLILMFLELVLQQRFSGVRS